MPSYEYVEIPTAGHSRSRSFSYYRPLHHVRPRCPDNCARVSLDDYNILVESERNARVANDRLARENRRLQVSNQDLQDRVDQSRGHHSREEKMRRKIEVLRLELEAKDLELRDLKKEKDLADIRVRELSQTVTDQNLEIDRLEDEIRSLKHVHKKDKHALGERLGERTEQWRQARALVEDLQRQLQRYREPFFSRRPYGFGGI
ncbi:hypothetical protein F5Y10DRAFT_51892 [Nemania abortiva]|nr:hypothetical protein F5Y10DRAFT_51892 [Nemania abortiva]